MKKTAVLLYPQFSEYELSAALSILMQGNKPIITVGLTKNPIKGESGLSCVADATVHEVEIDEIDSLLLPGCMDIRILENEHSLFEFIEKVAERDPVIASISSSPFLLAKAGVLKGKRFTVGLTEEAIQKLNVFERENYTSDLLVQDGKLITARGSAFIRFGIEFGKTLYLQFHENWYKE